MNIQYLNHPPYPNRWMITLIQQGSVCDLESSEPGCQEDEVILFCRKKYGWLWICGNSEQLLILPLSVECRPIPYEDTIKKSCSAHKNSQHKVDLSLYHRPVGRSMNELHAKEFTAQNSKILLSRMCLHI